MAAEIGIELPPYVEVGVTAISLLVVAVVTRLGWVRAAKTEPEAHVEMAGAVVDARAVKSLIDTIEFAMDRVADLHDMRMRHDKKQADDSADLQREIRLLRVAIESLTKREAPHA